MQEVRFAGGSQLKILQSCAFKDCEKLRAICLPDGLLEIGKECFNGCNIKNLQIPQSVTAIGENAIPITSATITRDYVENILREQNSVL